MGKDFYNLITTRRRIAVESRWSAVVDRRLRRRSTTTAAAATVASAGARGVRGCARRVRERRHHCALSVHHEKNHTVCRHSGGAIFLFICIKKQIIRLAVIQAEWNFLIYLYFYCFLMIFSLPN